jgi:hypothetical protein
VVLRGLERAWRAAAGDRPDHELRRPLKVVGERKPVRSFIAGRARGRAAGFRAEGQTVWLRDFVPSWFAASENRTCGGNCFNGRR